MKRLIVLYTLIAFASMAMAQILVPMGSGLPAAPDKFASYHNGIAAVYDDRDGNIELQVWNGDFWYALETPNLPNTGLTSNGEFKIIDLLAYDDVLYLAVGYTHKLSPSAQNSILRWENNTWNNVSTPIIEESVSLDKLFIEDNTIKCIGKFKVGTSKYNVTKLVGTSWIAEGNLLTKNLEGDNFKSLVVTKDKVYATGRFTNHISGNISLASWNGLEWSVTELPPFLNENIAVGSYHGDVVAYGTSDHDPAAVKIFTAGTWMNLSAGLADYEVNSINQFAEVQGNLFAIGAFTQKNNSTATNIMMYNGTSWSETNLTLSNIEQLYYHNEGIVISGDFSDNSNLNGLGFVVADKAQIIARVYNDVNGNCTKESNEEWIRDYPVFLKNENIYVPTGQNGQLYLQVTKDKYTFNAGVKNYFSPTCPDITLNVDEYKTYYGAALGVRQVLGITDVSVHLSDNGGTKTAIGEDKKATLCIQNLGSQPITDATLSLTIGASFDNLTTDLPYDKLENGVATWTINLNQGESRCFEVGYSVLNQTELQLIASVITRNGIADSDVSNNSSPLTYEIGINTPNTKQCINGRTIAPQTELLKYKVGIRNTTGRLVTGLTVVDELDPDIVLSAKLQNIYTSHAEFNPITRVEPYINDKGERINKLITTWENIHIEPASETTDAGTAHVDYHLNVLSFLMTEGIEICNTAKIYFKHDGGYYDEPKTTNQVCSNVSETLIIVTSVQKPTSLSELTLGPNPVDGTLFIDNKSNEKYTLQLVNSLGQSIEQIVVRPSSKTSLNMTNLNAGIYIVYANGLFAQKIVLR
jgi:hypothetical protein